jgi:hypothetical protein
MALLFNISNIMVDGKFIHDFDFHVTNGVLNIITKKQKVETQITGMLFEDDNTEPIIDMTKYGAITKNVNEKNWPNVGATRKVKVATKESLYKTFAAFGMGCSIRPINKSKDLYLVERTNKQSRRKTN